MDTKQIIEDFQKDFKTDILDVIARNEKRIVITIRPEAILRVSEYLYKSAGFRFIIASALHTKKGFEIHYHFSRDEAGLILNIHVVLNKDNPQIESLSNMFNASNWIEREMHELFGINFLNHPNLEKLLSEGNWAEGVYPYRKEFK
ncbi:MAG: NADH-quinone oxidoreductase subunit C [Bacteroidales bacterium]|nr:NADH-quinone oxidoreductase subunit C [Bacteroidales bacterium]